MAETKIHSSVSSTGDHDEEAPPQLPLQKVVGAVKNRNPCTIMGFAICYAYFNVTTTGLATLTLFGLFLYWTISIVLEIKNRGPPQIPPLDLEAQNLHDYYNISICAMLMVLVLFAAIALLFAILLLQGVQQKKSHLLRAYFVYVCVMIALFGSCGATYYFLTDGEHDTLVCIAGVILILYGLAGILIDKAYGKIKVENIQHSPSSDIYMDPDEDQEDNSSAVSPITSRRHHRLELAQDTEEVEFVINNAIKHMMYV